MGARTLIAGSDGAGDALTGLIAGYLRQHFEPILAGDIVTDRCGGTTCLNASGFIEQFPRALARFHE
jgi:NAD(P)H-hydrate repair Nnr-like enzyme with NAD(P)H-hydrate dehydratase domain